MMNQNEIQMSLQEQSSPWLQLILRIHVCQVWGEK